MEQMLDARKQRRFLERENRVKKGLFVLFDWFRGTTPLVAHTVNRTLMSCFSRLQVYKELPCHIVLLASCIEMQSFIYKE